MRKLPALCTTFGAALALAACGAEQTGPMTSTPPPPSAAYQQLNSARPTGSNFDRALFDRYAALAKSEYNQGDWKDADAYSGRAMTAAQASAVMPESISARNLPADKVGELSGYRGRLVTALDRGARDRQPADAAEAQTKFDCWMEQQEENHQPGHIAACRAGFLTALSRIEGQPVAAAPPPPQPGAETFTLYFDTNKASLNAQGQRELQQIVQRARANNAKMIKVEGYADRAGKDDYNVRLSQRREATVHDAIHKAGLNARIDAESYGEARPAVPTADGVAEARNRRVVVTLMP
jgi:OOP family OmpA-OmpF porin